MLGRETLSFRLVFLFLLQIDVQGVFIELHLEAVDVVKLLVGFLVFRSLEERDFVLAWGDTQREVFALAIGLQVVLLAVVHVVKLDDTARNGLALWVFARTLDRS